MKQPMLVAALGAAAWLLVDPLLHWFLRWQLDPVREVMGWLTFGVLALLVPHAAERRHAGWAATFAGLTVALNPFWPLGAPDRAMTVLSTAAGVALAVYALRRWK